MPEVLPDVTVIEAPPGAREGGLLPSRWPVTLRGGRGWVPPVPLLQGVCGICATVLVGRRRSWCSPYCEDLAAICSTGQATRVFVWHRDGGVCAHCPPDTPPQPRFALTTTDGWEVDHVVPLHQGGSYLPDNLQTLCRPHHWAKSAAERRR